MQTFIHFQTISLEQKNLKKIFFVFQLKCRRNLIFFSAVVFGIYYLNAKENATDLLAAINSIEPDKFSKLRKIKQGIMLDYTVFGYLDKCLLLNDVLARYFGCFLRFYERRNKYRYQLRKKLKSKNEIHSEILSCVQQKLRFFNIGIEKL